MFIKTLLPALAALSLTVSVNADACSDQTVTINSAADAKMLANCDTVEGTIRIGSDATGDIALDGPKQVKGDVQCENNPGLNSLTSSSITDIGGTLTLKNVTGLTTIDLSHLRSAKALAWQTLSRLERVSFTGGGLQKAERITISDTFLGNLEALNVTSPKFVQIDNNRRLQTLKSGIQTLSDRLIITANGIGLKAAFPQLRWISNMTISNVSEISLPALSVVNGSLRMDSNFFTSFSAPNLTHTESGDISFTDNSNLNNITFPQLTKVSGGLTIANNTKLSSINGFEKLKTVGGAVRLRGNFTEVDLPALQDVKGAFTIASTSNIQDTCNKYKSLTNGGNKVIQGTFSCTSQDQNANKDKGDGKGNGNKGGAASLGSNLSLMLTVVGAVLML